MGATGLLGDALTRAWAPLAAVTSATHRGRGGGYRLLDVRDARAVRVLIEEIRPAIVAFAAANPHVDYCETHPEETRAVNVAGLINVARASRQAGARTIFFSSDYVFDGRKDVYEESDAVSPLNEYGRQKVEAELAALSEDPNGLVVRTAGLYGWQREPKNFVLQVVARLSAGQRMKVAADLRYNPTAADNLAQAVVALADKARPGVYHAVGSERIGRLEFARAVARTFGLDESLLDAAASADFASAAPRPKSSSLSTEKLRREVDVPLWGVREGLDRMKASQAVWRRHVAELPSV